ATLLMRRNNIPRTIEVLKAGVAANPKSVRLLGMLSDAYVKNKEPEAASAILDQISSIAPEDATLRTRLAAQRLRIGQANAAVDDLEVATELDPKSTQAGLLLVLTFLQSNKIDEALKAAEEMRERVPDDPL